MLNYKSAIFMSVLFLILFAAWQFRVLAKYNFGYPAIRIKPKNEEINIGKQCIKFKDIKAVRIIDEEQPSIVEKALSKGASYIHLSRIEFYFKNETMLTVKCNSKQIITKLITELTPFAEIFYDEKPEEYGRFTPLLVGLGFILIMFGIVFLITGTPH